MGRMGENRLGDGGAGENRERQKVRRAEGKKVRMGGIRRRGD